VLERVRIESEELKKHMEDEEEKNKDEEVWVGSPSQQMKNPKIIVTISLFGLITRRELPSPMGLGLQQFMQMDQPTYKVVNLDYFLSIINGNNSPDKPITKGK
jgi:hypothetical protein